jgi:NADPH2:quinone reductase
VRALVVPEYGGPEVLTEADRPVPDPGPGAVRIAVAAAGLHFADVEKRRGDYPDAPEPPFVAGMEAAGRIDAVGPGVDREAGEFVAGFAGGAFAEYALVDADLLVDVPASLSAAEAAGVPVQWITAHNCLHEWGGLAAGERVLVHAAAGGVGSAAVQLAAHAGATVLGTASTAEKLAFARDCGADHAINYEERDVAAAVAEATDGAGVDLVLDGVGGRAFAASVEALADCGRIVAYGMASGRPGTVSTPRLLFSNRSLLGYHLEHGLEHVPDRVATARAPLERLLADGDVRVRIGGRWPLAEAAVAYERLESRASTGKLLVEP